ncbi:MAG: GIY-YIG nuclease family protein [Bacteroidales bacterium]
MKHPCVYIMTNKNNTTLYCGVTSDPTGRIKKHKTKHYPGSFTSRYNLHKLVYYEFHENMRTAIAREKQIKAGPRKKKVALIQSFNPEWKDLYMQIVAEC